MGLFSGNSSMEQAVEASTDGKKTAEDWQEIMQIVDQIEQQPQGAKDALKAIMKRVKNSDPHVGLLALTLLDACVANAKRKFHLEVSSRVFEDEVKGMFKNSGSYHRELLEKFALLIKKWSENEFKSDPALALIPALWNHIKLTKSNFIPEGSVGAGKSRAFSSSGQSSSDPATVQRKEEDDFAKAIALSLEEENKKKRSGSTTYQTSGSVASSGSALYPSMNSAGNNAIYATVRKEPKELRKVRAMYDFEAVEDNELTVKAGEIIHVQDDSDPNWWKGYNHRGDGLFPTNFVTSDLNWEPENQYASNPKKKVNDEVASLTSAETPVELKAVTIDEALVDRTLHMIHDADPEGERPDSAELLELEEQCSRMWPLIDAEVQKTDKLQSALEEVSVQINDALALYDSVMKEQAAQMPPMGYSTTVDPNVPPGHYAQAQPGQYGPPQPYPGYQEQSYAGGYVSSGPYGPPAPAPPGMQYQQNPQQQPGYQQFAPHPGKLAAAQASMSQQFVQQQQPPPTGFSSQSQPAPYHSYLQQPPQ